MGLNSFKNLNEENKKSILDFSEQSFSILKNFFTDVGCLQIIKFVKQHRK